MTYSYTQISHYLRCPRSYRYRYLDGCAKRTPEQPWSLAAALKRPSAPTSNNRTRPRHCSRNGLLSATRHFNTGRANPGIGSFTKESTYRNVRTGGASSYQTPRWNLQLTILGPRARQRFISYINAIGELDGQRCLIDWKTTTSHYLEEPDGLLSLDPQLICYSWISGIPDVAFVVFVRKHLPEIQYLKATNTEEQQREFGRFVEATVNQIESGQFPSHSGIRFPQNGCLSCPHLGLCLNNQQLIETNLIRRPGASDLDWLDELVD